MGCSRPIFRTSNPDRHSLAPDVGLHLISTRMSRSKRTFEIDWSWITDPSVGVSRLMAVVVSRFSPSMLIWMKFTVRYCESRLLLSWHRVCRIMAKNLTVLFTQWSNELSLVTWMEWRWVMNEWDHTTERWKNEMGTRVYPLSRFRWLLQN